MTSRDVNMFEGYLGVPNWNFGGEGRGNTRVLGERGVDLSSWDIFWKVTHGSNIALKFVGVSVLVNTLILSPFNPVGLTRTPLGRNIFVVARGEGL